MTSKESVAAQNRFIYYPDHLVRMPGPGSSILDVLSSMLSEPVFQGVLYGIATELFHPAPDELSDESVGDFLSRRLGSSVADNIVSAIIHGIYAGDIYQLSAKSILGKVYRLEEWYGSLVWGSIRENTREFPQVPLSDKYLMTDLSPFSDGPPMSGTETIAQVRKSSVYTFKRGIGELAESLESALQHDPNVTILKETPIESLEMVNYEQILKVFPHAEIILFIGSQLAYRCKSRR